MTTVHSSTTAETSVEVAGLRLHAYTAGSGPPAVLLHHSTGPMWTQLADTLAQDLKVVAPDLPGYGQSDRPVWARHPRDVAILVGRALDALGINRGIHLVGLGFGGWVAAELATFRGDRLATLTLVGAPGLKPRSGEILDPIFISYEEYLAKGFHDLGRYQALFGEQADEDTVTLLDYSREMTCRLTWKPWMFSRQLPHLLPAVDTPALVVWGRHDAVVPLDCGEQYAEQLPNARLEIVENCGHSVDLEQPQILARLVSEHVARNA
jgi:pimeloyl-ACP methyl ester carboxylesterase